MDQTIIDHHISILRGKLKGLKNTDLLGDDTINASIALWQKQVPKKVVPDKDRKVKTCPACARAIEALCKTGTSVLKTPTGYIGHYCPWCGQAITQEG